MLARYHPEVGSFVQEIPAFACVPSAFKNGASIPPRPVRDSESVSDAAMSSIVGFAHVESIVVFGTTGFPAGSE